MAPSPRPEKSPEAVARENERRRNEETQRVADRNAAAHREAKKRRDESDRMRAALRDKSREDL